MNVIIISGQFIDTYFCIMKALVYTNNLINTGV